jgi:hypothetical protein
MKMSVYIPDELWAKVKAIDPETGVSQVVQGALREKVAQVEGRATYKELDETLQSSLEEAAAKATARVADTYRMGYRVGLHMSAELSAEGFADFEATGWDLEEFKEDAEEREWPLLPEGAPGYVYSVEESWHRLASDHTDLARLPNLPTGVMREGVVDAIRDVWERAAHGRVLDEPRPPASTPAAAPEVPSRLRVVGNVLSDTQEVPGDPGDEGGAEGGS